MRFILILLWSIVFSPLLKAEYNGYHLQFEIETVKGNKIIGYSYVYSSFFNSDSINDTNYLVKVLDLSNDGVDGDSLHYFMDRIKYKYRQVGDSQGEKIPIYTLDNKQVIPDKEIRSIDILESINQTYMIGISSPLSISDTTWTNKEPLKSYSFGAYLCYHQIFIHKNSKEIENIITRLSAKQKKTGKYEIDQETGDKLDAEFSRIIEELILLDEKIVVITECSC